MNRSIFTLAGIFAIALLCALASLDISRSHREKLRLQLAIAEAHVCAFDAQLHCPVVVCNCATGIEVFEACAAARDCWPYYEDFICDGDS